VKTFIRRHPIGSFYGSIELVAWSCFAGVVGRRLVGGGSMRAVDAFILFPMLVISVALVGLTWARVVEGKEGAKLLLARVRLWRVGVRWYFTALLIPPALILGVLGSLRAASPDFTPGFFSWGVLIGLFPGWMEEIGWMGYLFPQLRRRHSALASAVLLGLLWGCWHLPVINFLGAAGPHGTFLFPYFVAFTAVLTAMRVLMVWVYNHTGSVLLMQLMHASSTGCLILFSPPHVSAANEAIWYGTYAVALWIAVAVVVAVFGKELIRGEVVDAANVPATPL
jgi:membrane protease YdiL (CAAX protease family)